VPKSDRKLKRHGSKSFNSLLHQLRYWHTIHLTHNMMCQLNSQCHWQ